MANPVEALADYIATDLALGTVGTNIFLDYLPDASDGSLDTAIVVYSTAGAPPTLTQDDDTDSPGFLIACRSLDADTARGNEQTIYQALHGLTETDVHGVHFKLLYAIQSGPTPLGRDEKQRFIFHRAYRAYVRGATR